MAFARQGYGVVAPITSGAHEFASDHRDLGCARDSRFLYYRRRCGHDETGIRPCGNSAASEESAAARPRPAFADAEDRPLVTIITPTYNRRTELQTMLGCIAAQTYPNIESIVVNDGGEPVDDIVAMFPFARL